LLKIPAGLALALRYHRGVLKLADRGLAPATAKDRGQPWVQAQALP